MLELQYVPEFVGAYCRYRDIWIILASQNFIQENLPKEHGSVGVPELHLSCGVGIFAFCIIIVCKTRENIEHAGYFSQRLRQGVVKIFVAGFKGNGLFTSYIEARSRTFP